MRWHHLPLRFALVFSLCFVALHAKSLRSEGGERSRESPPSPGLTQGGRRGGEDSGEDSEDRQLWRPSEVGRTREDWLRCRGFPCDKWERTKRKLLDLQVAVAGKGYDMELLLNGTKDDSLDDCIWLTEEQIDEVFERMEEEFRTDPDAGQGQGQGHAKGHSRQKRKITNFQYYSSNMWLDKTVHWKFDGMHDANERRIVRGAFQHWEDQTCIDFVEIPTGQELSTNHILVTKQQTGCHSFVGRINQIPQQLNLQRECLYNFGTSVHEVGHALGLWHEQQRSDRDQTIRVLWDNLGYYAGQFYLQGTHNLVPYDLGSVMHYAPKDGSKNGMDTMRALNPWEQQTMGQRIGLSFFDTKIVNLAYCSDVCVTPLPQSCQHGGYQDPRDCSRCRCPDGLGGLYCQQVASPVNADCGGDIVATSSPQYIESPGYNTDGFYQNHQECSWLVKAPSGSRVALTFEGDFGLYCYYQGQCHHWVEVKYKSDIGARGPRFCCYSTPQDTIVSEGSEMLVVFKANDTRQERERRGFRARVISLDDPDTTTTTTPRTTTTSADTDTTTEEATTATIKPTTATTVPTGKPEVSKDCVAMDLIIAVDSSNGVLESNWPKMLHFVKNVIRKFPDLSPEGVRVALIAYGSYATLEFPLGHYHTADAYMTAVDAVTFKGGATGTALALARAGQHWATHGRGKTTARQALILVTDGQTRDPDAAINQAFSLRALDVDVFVVGITSKVDVDEAIRMSGDADRFVSIESFDDAISTEISYPTSVYSRVCPQESGVGGTSALDWRCSFESDVEPLCGMSQESSGVDQFDWSRQEGHTPSAVTGPMMAQHGAHYIYIETSAPRIAGDLAIIYTPSFQETGLHCASFHYNMYGHHVRTLEMARRTPTGTLVSLWQRSGQQGMAWYEARVDVTLSAGDQIAFIGVRGDEYSGDIAIDNIRIRGGAC